MPFPILVGIYFGSNKIIFYHTMYLLTYCFLLLVHPCDKENKGGCSQICMKRGQWHACLCKAGFVLTKDNKTCIKGERHINYHVSS